MLNLGSLNPQQRLAVETLKGPVLILAGAGTGKTRVITFRIAHMIEKGIAPGNILAVTFTNKAAREMQERVNKLVPRKRSDRSEESKADTRPTICTFHSLCVRILRQHIEKLGYRRNFVIYNESEQLSAVKKILAQISAKGEKTDAAEILSILSRFKNGGQNGVTVGGDESARAIAEHIQARYQSALHACNAVDFDDLILLTLRLFKEHSEALQACRTKFRYVMVDEYQDTNAAQFNLVYSLTREHRNLCVVGDDDQSIYGWRGADISNLLDMEKHFPEVKVVKLEQNYRSTTTILNAANAVIQKNVRRRGKRLWSQKDHGAKITLHTFESDEEEARTIVEEIAYNRSAKRIPWSAQAILFRTNAQSRPFETELRKNSIRYHLIGGQSYFDRREVRDFLAYLKVFLNPNDDVSLLRIANTPARGLSDATMEKLLAASQERKCSVFAAMKNPAVSATFAARTRECLETFVDFVERTHNAILHPPTQPNAGSLSAWADRFLDEIGYYQEIRRLEKTAEAAESRIRNVQELVLTLEQGGPANTAALQFGGSADSSRFDQLQTFLEEITLDSEREEEEEATGDQVTLITMHSCKGLEFPHVYVVGLEEGLLPHGRSALENTLDEERRLFYVAITRAMQTLTISHCASRKKFGKPVPGHPSRFLMEIPEELIEHGEEKGKQPVTTDSGRNLFEAMRASIE